MTRLAPVLAAATATLMLAAPALAADFDNGFDAGGNAPGMRGGFSDDAWANSDENDPLTFSTGIRYWYSIGSATVGASSSTSVGTSSTVQSGEVFARVNDSSTGYYAKGLAGTSFNSDGGGSVSYGGGDLGYTMLGSFNSPLRVGPFAGYMYWNDSPDGASSANNFATLSGGDTLTWDHTTGITSVPRDSTTNTLEMNMLRLGMSGEAKLGMFDLSGEVAAVPYAKVNGQLGTVGVPTQYYTGAPGSGDTGTTTTPNSNNIAAINTSPTAIDGWGYGAMVEGLVGFHPTNNMTLRLGGRAWYLQGKADTTLSRVSISNPTQSDPTAPPPNFDVGPTVSPAQGIIVRSNPWSVLRYGLLAEFSYQF